MATESGPIEIQEALVELYLGVNSLTHLNRAAFEKQLEAPAIVKALTAIRQEVERIALVAIGPDEEIKLLQKPTHGNCCTCQDCGLGHDDCRCGDIAEENEFKAKARERLAAALRGLEGK